MKFPQMIVVIGLITSTSTGVMGQTSTQQAVSIPLDQLRNQHSRNVKTDLVTYKGRKALRVTDAAPVNMADGVQLVILDNTQFRDGTIEIEMAGKPKSETKSSTPRGFVGVAFRLNLDPSTDNARYECFYIRPTNGRADDQIRRNHATQYISYPDRPWFKLRDESPGKYESYADMVAGDWTKVKIDVMGKRAELYVGSASQPVLVVNDLQQEAGQIALWVGTDTVAHFSNLRVRRANPAAK